MHSKTLLILRVMSSRVLKSLTVYAIVVLGLFGFYLAAGFYIIQDVRSAVDDPVIYALLLGFGFGGATVACISTLMETEWFSEHVRAGEAFFSTIHYPILERVDNDE